MDLNIMYGTAGWSYPDWQGTIYPKPKPKGFNPLFFLSHMFNFVEVNMTFYTIPTEKIVTGWINKTRMCPNFFFWIKAFNGFTHKRVYITEDIKIFKQVIKPLFQNKKLGGILFQFPYSFKFSSSNFSYIETLIGNFCEYQTAFEFRHNSWNHPDVLDYLSINNSIWVNIDQPVISKSLPLTSILTNEEITYFRLHGRNYKTWFADKGRDERYNYDYKIKELDHLANIIKNLKNKTKKIFISANNHYQGNAVKNLLTLKKLLNNE